LLRDAAESTPSIAVDYDAPVVGCFETDHGVRSFSTSGVRTDEADLLVIADGGGRRSLSRTLDIRQSRGRRGARQYRFVPLPNGLRRDSRSPAQRGLDRRAPTQGGWVVFLNSGRGLLTVNTRHVVGAGAPTALQLAFRLASSAISRAAVDLSIGSIGLHASPTVRAR
jgi:hypothetical protein